MTGMNICEFRDFWTAVFATRMSGEMCTSLGNGFANLMANLFIHYEKGADIEEVPIVIEGDDGLIADSMGVTLEPADYSSIGLKVKIIHHDQINTASFCGIVFDQGDADNITNPLEALASFGWTTHDYALSNEKTKLTLLRCKALSLAYQYPGCPIISSLARYGMRVTNSFDVRRILEKDRSMSQWQRDKLLDAYNNRHSLVLDKPVGDGSRLLVEELYGIPVEIQYAIENHIDSMQEVQPLEFDYLDVLYPRDWINYWNTYVLDRTPQEVHTVQDVFYNVNVA